jgi:hypothetical protein
MGDTGNSLQTSIGHHFERALERELDDLVIEKIPRHPDLHSVGRTFWIEAKAGQKANGPHVHDFQWWYTKMPEPVLYAFGYHTLKNARECLGRFSTEQGRQNYLWETLKFESVYFIDAGIVRNIYEREKGKGAGRSKFDLVMQSSIPKHVVTGREFTRKGVTITGPDFYGYDSADYIARELAPVQGLPFKCGYFVKKQDEAVLQFFKRNGM